MAEVFVVYDPLDQANIAELAPDLVDFRSCALRVEPTPIMGRCQLTHDLLRALRRRPNLAFRWSESSIGDLHAARLWCRAHGIRHVLIPRAHTVETRRLTEFLAYNPGDDFSPADEPLTWWLIDSSVDGSLVGEMNVPSAVEADVSRLREAIRATRWREDYRGYRQDSRGPAPTTFGHAVSDAHPTLFVRQLQALQPAEAAGAVRGRFTSAARVMSSDWFDRWESALWHCLRAARDDADALVLFRGAQLALLKRRLHLTMRSDLRHAVADATTRLASAADRLLAYVDPLVASIGALALETGFRPSMLQTLLVQDVDQGFVPANPGFDVGAQHRRLAPYVAAQVSALRAAELPRSSELFHHYVPCTYRGARRPTTLTTDRITAVLRTLEIERGIDRHHLIWIAEHGITVAPL